MILYYTYTQISADQLGWGKEHRTRLYYCTYAPLLVSIISTQMMDPVYCLISAFREDLTLKSIPS